LAGKLSNGNSLKQNGKNDLAAAIKVWTEHPELPNVDQQLDAECRGLTVASNSYDPADWAVRMRLISQHLSGSVRLVLVALSLFCFSAGAPTTDLAGEMPVVPTAQITPALIAPAAQERRELWRYVSGSAQSIKVTIRAGARLAATSAKSDFAPGQGIAIPKTGKRYTDSSPESPLVEAVCTTGPCVASYEYRVVALDDACGSSAASLPSRTVKNARNLDYQHFNSISIAIDTDTEAYLLFRGSTPIGVVPASSKSDRDRVVQYRDVGEILTIGSPCLPTEPPSEPTPDALYTSIVSVEATGVRLRDSARSEVRSVTSYHDDTAAIGAAFSKLDAKVGGTVQLPATRFTLSRPILIGGPKGALIAPGLAGTRAHGALAASPMMQGMPVIKITNAFEPYLGHLSISGSVGAEPLAAIEHRVDRPGGDALHVSGTYIGNALDEDIDDSVNFPLYGIIYTDGPGSDENDSENTIRDFNGGGLRAGVWYGHLNSLQNRIFGGNIAGQREGAIKFTGGSANVWGSVVSSGDNGYLVYMDKGYIMHDCGFHGLQSESNAGLIFVDKDASTNNYLIAFDGGDFAISPMNAEHLSVDFENKTMSLSMQQVRLAEGAESNWITDAKETTLLDNRLSMTSIRGESRVRALSNLFTSVTPKDLLITPGKWTGELNDSEGPCLDCFLNRRN
jgi:hypothetical protein